MCVPMGAAMSPRGLKYLRASAANVGQAETSAAMASPSTPASSVGAAETGEGSGRKRRGGAMAQIGNQVEDDMHRAARKNIEKHFSRDPSLVLRVSHLLDSGKLLSKSTTEDGYEPIPLSCNKWHLLRKERWQIIMAGFDQKCSAEATMYISKDSLCLMGCFAMCVKKESALPQTLGKMELLMEWCAKRYQDMGNRLRDMGFSEARNGQSIEPDFPQYGAFRLVADSTGNVEKLRHIAGAEIHWLGGPLARYKLINNHEEDLARVVDIETDMESPVIRLFNKANLAASIPKFTMVKCVKDQPLDPDSKMKRAKKGPVAKCPLLNAQASDIAMGSTTSSPPALADASELTSAPLVPPPGAGGSGGVDVRPPPI